MFGKIKSGQKSVIYQHLNDKIFPIYSFITYLGDSKYYLVNAEDKKNHANNVFTEQRTTIHYLHPDFEKYRHTNLIIKGYRWINARIVDMVEIKDNEDGMIALRSLEEIE